MRSFRCLGIPLTAAFLICGCGGGGSPAPVAQPPSGLSHTTLTADYTQGAAITPNRPSSSGGTVTSYNVNPPLPAGLIMSSNTGVISGTPTAVSAPTSYTVTASNSSGSTSVSLSITVIVAAPANLSYSTGTAVYTVGTPIPPDSPTGAGGAVASYGVSPELPEGLSLDDHSGIITGTPAAVTPATKFTVMASNLTGATTATLTITVNAAAPGVQFIPNMNQFITPLAPQGSQFQSLVTPWLLNGNPWLAGQAVSSVVSGNTLLVLTSGFNRIFYADFLTAIAFVPEPPVVELAPGKSPAAGGLPANSPSSEYVFIYNISTGAPVYQQTVMIPNSYNGITFDPTQLPVPPSAGLVVPKSTHSAQYWARVTEEMNFSDADLVDSAVYNRILWKGTMGNKPYPAGPTGVDLHKNRKELLASYQRSLKQKALQNLKAATK